jgi:hypothetical protein
MDIPSSKERKVPQYAGGYSNSDAQQYRFNRINQLGSTKPFLIRNRMDVLDKGTRREIAMLICDTIKLFDISNEYPESTEDKEYDSIRLGMRRDFWEYMGMVEADEPYFRYFLIEGFSFISEALIKFHMDSGNDIQEGFGQTYSLKTKILITPTISKIPAMKVFMKALQLEIGNYLPLSLMMYSKKIVGDYALKMNIVQSLLKEAFPHQSSKLTAAMLEKIMDTEAPENYRNLWDKTSSGFEHLCKNMKAQGSFEKCGTRKHKGIVITPPSEYIPRQFKGSFTSMKPAFDKSVS